MTNLREQSAVIAAAHCEAKLHGFRRTADGVVVSFVLHPHEVPPVLALDPLGTRYMLALCAIGDDEQPVSPAGTVNHQQKGTATGKSPGKDTPPPVGEPHKDRRAWDELRPSQQAGILCSDVGFQKFVSEETGWACDEADAAAWLRAELDITSRKELDLRPDLAPKLNEIRAEFLEWAGRVPMAVR